MKKILLLVVLTIPAQLSAQQVSDSTFQPTIKNPLYEQGHGPVVHIDEGHHNFHTRSGRYSPFARLLESDGYTVKEYKGLFTREGLSEVEILVIANALNELNVEEWYLPNPSAFSHEEIKVVKKWVRRGGSLFLIADHMPMAGAATDLAAAFNFEFTNGFVMDTIHRGAALFKLEDGTLYESLITRGSDTDESVSQIASFTGQGFNIPKDANPVLIFNENYVNLLPDTAWVFDETTSIYNVEGWSQGAYKKVGRGKIVVFGEAGMFTAQLAGPNKIRFGMNSDVAPENFQLLLNIIHWLDGKLE